MMIWCRCGVCHVVIRLLCSGLNCANCGYNRCVFGVCVFRYVLTNCVL